MMKKIFATVILFFSLFSASTFAVAQELDERHNEEVAITEILAPAPPFISDIEIDADAIEMGFDNDFDNNEEDVSAIAERLKDYAAKYLGTRYVWGATGPKSFDCSGFTGYVFKSEGIKLPRTSSMQYTQGTKVAHKEWKPGDLLFFSSRRSGKGKVGHVAMVVDVNPDGSCTFIHASTKKGVTYQKFPDNAYYSRNYVGAKRIIDSDPS